MITKWKLVFSFILILAFVILVYFGGFFSNYCVLKECMGINLASQGQMGMLTTPDIVGPDYKMDTEDFDIDENDVLVFLHMQKTGGTFFGRALVKNLDVDPPCVCKRKVKRCDCLTDRKKLWLFSRYSTGWKCGLHADWTELQYCVDQTLDQMEGSHRKRRLHYITYLRDPIKRYISEWKHVNRGATWRAANLKCNGKPATLEEVPFCYEGSTWKGVSLDEFLECPHNLANNRQTRMLADLRLVNCYNKTGMNQEKRDAIMLESAKHNLKETTFFGITDLQNYSQALFEKTFQLSFLEDFEQKNRTHSEKVDYSKYTERLKENNQLDLDLFEFAKTLFFKRLKSSGIDV